MKETLTQAEDFKVKPLKQRNARSTRKRRPRLFARIGKSYKVGTPIDNFKIVAKVSNKH